MDERVSPIALALSGGGIRAMAFHLGVLQQLAERGLLERVEKISSVSGGSLLLGLVFKESGFRWPTSSEFLQTIYPALKGKLCACSMQWGALRQLLNPGNFRFLLSRSNLLAATLRREWDIVEPLTSLPLTPEWAINGTNAENGRRFRFKRDSIGDYRTGYASPGNFPLANALAVSAAFPGGFGPLSLRTRSFVWKKRAWGAPKESEQVISLIESVLHLYDGGVYDNLGLESFFDAGTGQSKVADHVIVVSDGGLPLSNGFSSNPINPFRLKRVADIMSDQTHGLRIRTFLRFLSEKPGGGVLINITDACPQENEQKRRDWACQFPTTLRKLSCVDFEKLSGHGYHVAEYRLPAISVPSKQTHHTSQSSVITTELDNVWST